MNVYRIIINDDDLTGMDAISLVKEPAVLKNALTFSEEKRLELRKFDEDKHIISGVVALADTPIYRYDPQMGEYYVIFTKDVIEKMVEKYAKCNLYNSVNLQHDDTTFQEGIYMIESYIVNARRGIVPIEFEDVPDGSWIVSYKVENEALWRAIKESGELNGFSLQGIFQLEQTFSQNYNQTNKYKELMKLSKIALRNLLLQFEDVESDKGMLTIDGDIAVGANVFVGEDPAADGEYRVADQLLVIAEGKIAEIRPLEAEEPKAEPVEVAEEEAPAEELEPITVEAPAEEVDKDAKIAELEARIAELEAENADLKAKMEEKDATIAKQEEQMKKSVEKLAAEKLAEEKKPVKKSIYAGLTR